MRPLLDLTDKERAELLANWGSIRAHGFLRPYLRRRGRSAIQFFFFFWIFYGLLPSHGSDSKGYLRHLSWHGMIFSAGTTIVVIGIGLAAIGLMEFFAWRSLERDWQARKRAESEEAASEEQSRHG